MTSQEQFINNQALLTLSGIAARLDESRLTQVDMDYHMAMTQASQHLDKLMSLHNKVRAALVG